MVEITILAHYEAVIRKRGWVHPIIVGALLLRAVNSDLGSGRLGGLPPEAPTDPDVRNSRLRLFGPRLCYVTFAICSSFVDTVMEPDVSAIFPSNVPVCRCPLPSAGSLGLVPPLHRY